MIYSESQKYGKMIKYRAIVWKIYGFFGRGGKISAQLIGIQKFLSGLVVENRAEYVKN